APLAKYRLGRFVAVSVIGGLEVIEVEHDDSKRQLRTHGAANLAFKCLFQVAAIEEARERVTNGLIAESLAQAQICDGETYLLGAHVRGEQDCFRNLRWSRGLEM